MNYHRLRSSDGAESNRVPLNILIVYDDRNAAIRAVNVLETLDHQFGDELEFRCELWRFDLIGLPGLYEMAVRAGDAADLIMISASCAADLSRSVKDWLSFCLDGKEPASAALAALLGSSSECGVVRKRTSEFLQKAAARNFLDFFQDTDLADNSASKSATESPEGITSATSTAHWIGAKN